MKQILLFALIIALPALLKAQDISEQQIPMITKITATWCPNCGTYGWSFFKNAIEDNQDNAIYVAAHPSGELVSPEGQGFNSNLGANGQPKFYLNNQDFGVNSGNGAIKRTQLKEAVDEMNATTAVVGTGIEVTRDGNELTAKTKVKFLTDVDGKYHFVVYAIEDHVIKFQQSVGATADHRYILRTSFGGNTFGEAVAEGTITSGTEVENTYTATIADSWNPDNLYYAAVVWQEVDGDYIYVNGSQVQETVISSAKDLAANAVQLSWMPAGDAHQIIVSADKVYQDAQLDLLDANGRLLQSQPIAQINTDRQSIPVATAQLPQGTYAVRISNRDFQTSILLVK